MADEGLTREVYARFGLAYYVAECLHRNLSTIYTLAPFETRAGITAPRIDERMAQAVDLTLGQLVNALTPWLDDPLQTTLAEVVTRRNYLAHEFWYERVHLMLSDQGLVSLVEELETCRDLFETTDRSVSEHFASQLAVLGITNEGIVGVLEGVISGEDLAPFNTQRRLLKQETAVRIWDAPVRSGGSALIFELEDGTLWQLCDVGLGWTRYSQTATDWKQNEMLTPYLPSRMNPRPGAPGSWVYALSLKGNAALVVRMSEKNPGSFVWTLRRASRPDP